MSGRGVLIFAGTAAVAAVIATAVFVTVGDGEPKPAVQALEHNGMVTGTVWVGNEDDASLTAIDAGQNKVVTSLTGIESPHNVQVSPDGRTLWAVSGTQSRAVMVDAKTLALHGTVPTGNMPAHIVVTPDGKTTYTTNNADNTVSAGDTTTMKPVATIPVGSGPHGLRPSPDGKWVYVANITGTTLSVIDTTTNKQVAEVEVGQSPAQVAFSPDGRFVYASLNGENAVAKVDVATRTLVGKVEVGVGPIQTYVSPDNRYLLVANQGTEGKPSTTVSILETKTFTVLRTVQTGKGAHGIVIEPSSRHAYITNMYGNDVAVLDLKALEVVARIPVGAKPNGLSFSPVTVSDRPATKIELPMNPGGGSEMTH